MIKSGQRIVPTNGNRLEGFTAFKSYEVVAGTGDANVSPISLNRGQMRHHDGKTCNIIDDNGNIRFVSLEYFRPFNLEMGLFH